MGEHLVRWHAVAEEMVLKDFAHVRVARDPFNAVDGVQIALGPLLVKSQERGRFEEKHGKGRHERIS